MLTLVHGDPASHGHRPQLLKRSHAKQVLSTHRAPYHGFLGIDRHHTFILLDFLSQVAGLS